MASRSVVNIVAGASHISWRDFLLGTVIGLVPGVTVASIFVDRVAAAIQEPGAGTFAMLAAMGAVLERHLELASPAQLGNDGKAIFKAECSSCHTLSAAGATGTIGPNLDQLRPKQATVVHQVTNGGAVMPAFKGKLTPAQIQAVATFVATSAGK